MKRNDIIETLLKSNLKEDDFYNSSVFYYLAGRFPDLTISQCVDIVDTVREKFI